MKCPLCYGSSEEFSRYRERAYFKCLECHSIFADPKNLLGPSDEMARYVEHNNDIYDPGYRSFVSPIVNTVLEKYSPHHVGLDFGSGTGPVITKMLEEKGYKVLQFDPFFHNTPEALTRKYDFIVSCEVIEHFYNPRKEFEQLQSMLNPGGELICMTDIYKDSINFEKWYYKDDPTHVFFYHPEAFEYIKERFGFRSVLVNNRLVRFCN
ncbi:MAG: class I SAM-dependent methyltransferase [Perlabentimonas sp.]